MPQDKIIDTFPAFLKFWSRVRSRPLDEQIDGWAVEYMAQWPELLAKQIEDYASQQLDWRQIARERVFPYLRERLPAMQEAHEHLRELCHPLCSRARSLLGLGGDVVFVIYVGIGCGAGWATTFRRSPAILFGLENIAECGWSDAGTIAGLVAHELGHLVHAQLRAQHGTATGAGPWWQLYEEGFAQHCEHLILETGTPHQARGDATWLGWCQGHRAWLAREFLTTVASRQPVAPFFGSWFDIADKSCTGYFLGHEIIKELEKRLTLPEIALLDPDEVKASVQLLLEQMAGDAAGQVGDHN
jgi:hypothetical protein